MGGGCVCVGGYWCTGPADGSTSCTCPVATGTPALHHSYSSDQKFSDFISITEQSRRVQEATLRRTAMPNHPFHCGGHRCATRAVNADARL